MSDELTALLEEYEERFDDLFPLMCTKGMDDSELARAVTRCLETGEPYDINDGDGRVY